MTDYQWPTVVLARLRPFSEDPCSKDLLLAQYATLEDIFSEQFGRRAVLFASARSGIGSILDYERIGRGDTVFVPHYSPHCLWDTVGRYTSPTATCAPDTKAALAVHKYGYVHQYPYRTPIIIEDSVDSLIVEPSASMPLLGKYEVFSLPKIIGTWCGGIITTSDAGFVEWVQGWRQGNNPLAAHQSKLKYLSILGKLENFMHPNFLEPTNRELDLNGLINIRDQMNYLNKAADIIQQRLDKVFRKFKSQYFEHKGRLPCVLPFNQKYYRVKHPKQWMVRHFNFKGFLYEDYEPCWILPLHFGINENLFTVLLDSLREI